MAQHDEAYKLIFSHVDMIQDLLQGFVSEDWVKHLNFGTLQKVNADYVSDKMHSRTDDIVWRVQTKDKEWRYIYIMLEFQSRNDQWMAMRMMTYTGLLYQDLIRQREFTHDHRLPSIFPIVIYNGESRWTAPQSVSELIAEPMSAFRAYSPQMRYFLLDEKRWVEQGLLPKDNLVADLVHLENSQELHDMHQLVIYLNERLKDPKYDSLRLAFSKWIRRIMNTKLLSIGEPIPDTLTLEEIDTMLAERVEQWTKDWKQQGLQEGRQEGLQEGQIKLLTRQLEHRFGALQPAHLQLLQAANPAQLEAWGQAILTAQSLDEFFATH
ncbi:DUF4351 domain-containing protein [Pseudomonas sp. CCM 7893]|uniref:DUF4351 domain-containing protein n=1 Tax=Pseudomonas spelaei TaxID=1055469 RepID=A0A6I3WB69_9PSED|nr:Rpn family recombination-promoting nuclease/putative transposase [Pseudomonas spelaei]MUF07960.1 DUF4351 domain-containing protein [Pseudomonas spelaei]